MTVVLVTGMSGTGKSAALAELARRGHTVVDTDSDGYCEEGRVLMQAVGSSCGGRIGLRRCLTDTATECY